MAKFENIDETNEKKDNKIKLSNSIDKSKAAVQEAELKLKSDVNLLERTAKKSTSNKTCLSIYLDDEDLELLKAIAYNDGVTVNRFVREVLIKEPLNSTRAHLTEDFDIKGLVKKYDNKYIKPKSKKSKK